MPMYVYRHPKTGKLYEEIRAYSEADVPYVADDGEKCSRVVYPKNTVSKDSKGLVDRNCEVWHKDPSYVKSLNPKYVKTRSGHRVRYDPTKHR